MIFFQFICNKCKKSFATQETLAQHKATQHAKEHQIFKCPDCYKTYTTPYNLADHMVNVHGKEREWATDEAKTYDHYIPINTKGNETN